MSEYPSSAGSGQSWMPSHAGGANPAQSHHQHRGQQQTVNAPFQCGICYDYLSSSVDDLDEHILKHKRELADRLEVQQQPTCESQDVAYISQNHQQLVYYEGPPHAGVQGQAFEYTTQSGSNFQQAPQYRERAHDYKSAEKYYHHHPALLHHQASSPLTSLYATDNLNRLPTDSSSMQQDDFSQVPMKRGRFDSHAYERDEHQQHHAGRPDLNEENTADAEPPADSMRGDLENGPVSFASAESANSISYHAQQTSKQENASPTETDNGEEHPSANFGGEDANSLQDLTTADAPREDENDARNSNAQTSKESNVNDFESDLSSTVEGSSKVVEAPSDPDARTDNETMKGDASVKSGDFGVGHAERIPRTRRSARMHTGRR
ncbi:uncharacterized protein LOC100899689 [Galendromus occidentalis]|uniref:Uncharacterized protein LOC100899689 n=1 Tax=Galendromus occidentalis TaxID=34638 RepID=A0AAJ6VWH2_9ACAR|nr:uncharacterized protein LOC100899689 [Galendromus occidentalis]